MFYLASLCDEHKRRDEQFRMRRPRYCLLSSLTEVQVQAGAFPPPCPPQPRYWLISLLQFAVTFIAFYLFTKLAFLGWVRAGLSYDSLVLQPGEDGRGEWAMFAYSERRADGSLVMRDVVSSLCRYDVYEADQNIGTSARQLSYSRPPLLCSLLTASC